MKRHLYAKPHASREAAQLGAYVMSDKQRSPEGDLCVLAPCSVMCPRSVQYLWVLSAVYLCILALCCAYVYPWDFQYLVFFLKKLTLL